MYILLIGDIEAEICIEYLPVRGDVLFVHGNFYLIIDRYYNTDIEEWALRLQITKVQYDITSKWKESYSKQESGELYIDNYSLL